MTVSPAEYNITLMRNSIYATEFILKDSTDSEFDTTDYDVKSFIRDLDKSEPAIEVTTNFKDSGNNKHIIEWNIDTSAEGKQLVEDEYMYDVLLYKEGIKEYWIKGRIFVEDTVTLES